MVAITYNVYIDLNRDGDFADANEDITGYVKSVNIRRGVAQPYDTMARDTTIDLVLVNTDGRFSPDHPNGLSGLKPGALVKVAMTYNSVTVTLGIGRIARDGIDVEPGIKAGREARIRTYGLLRLLQEEKSVVLALQTNQRSDQIIETVITQAGIRPFTEETFVLDADGLCELDSALIGGDSIEEFLDLDAGSNTAAYVGDLWGQTVSVYGMLRDVMLAERGLLYERRDGWLAMRSRHYFIEEVANAVDAALDGYDLLARKTQDYAYGAGVLNDVSVTAYPRRVATSRSVVARLPVGSGANDGLIIPAGKTVSITLDYRNSAGNAIGAYDLLCQTSTDYVVNTWSSELQTVLSGGPSVTFTLTEGAGRVTLTWQNNDSKINAMIQDGSTETGSITVRGYAVETYAPATARQFDQASIDDLLNQPLSLDLKLLTEADKADELARWELAHRGDVRGAFDAVTLAANKSAEHAPLARDLTMASQISVTEDQTGTNRRYFIVGEEHRIMAGGEHYVTYRLRPAHTAFALLDVTGWNELDAVKLGY